MVHRFPKTVVDGRNEDVEVKTDTPKNQLREHQLVRYRVTRILTARWFPAMIKAIAPGRIDLVTQVGVTT